MYRDISWILNNIYINGPFWLWVHFVAAIFLIPVINGILKDVQVDILLLDKA